VKDVALTTNGWLLEKLAPALRAAGLDRLNVSVDSLDDATAGRSTALASRSAASSAASRRPRRWVSHQDQLRRAARGERRRAAGPVRVFPRARPSAAVHRVHGRGQHQPLDATTGRAGARDRRTHPRPLAAGAVGPAYRGEVAARYRYRDGRGEIGLISSVTEPFCRDCHRARFSADGKLYTCLFTSLGHDVLARPARRT
jgi:cyclic pyranopterin phosphate synthase